MNSTIKQYPKEVSLRVGVAYRIGGALLITSLFAAFTIVYSIGLLDLTMTIVFTLVTCFFIAGLFFIKNVAYAVQINETKCEATFFMVLSGRPKMLKINEISEIKDNIWLTISSRGKTIKLNRYYVVGLVKNLEELKSKTCI